jgi:superoxide dismutase
LVEDDKGALKIVNTKSSGTPLVPGRMNQYEGYTYQQIVDHVSKLNLPYTLPVDKEVGAYHPVLAINMWDTAYAVDYKCHKEAYVNQFITYIDWNVVHKRLFPGFR